MSERLTPASPSGAPAQPGGQVGRIGAAAVFYFMIVFGVGLLLGPLRVLWLEPWLGQTLAVLCEAPFLVLAMWLGARAAPIWARLNGGWRSSLAVGVMALALQQIADLAVGFGLRGMTLKTQVEYFASPPGMVYLFTLILFLLMPLVRRVLRKGEVA